MRAILRHQLMAWILQTVPLQVFFLFLFLSLDSFLITSPFPALYHGVLYYWAIYRPESFFSAMLLIGSLFFDTLVGYPLGDTFLEILCVFVGVLSQRKNLIHAPFVVVWACFIFCMTFFVSGVVLIRFGQSKPLLLWNLLYSFVWTAISYPLLNWGLQKLNRFLDQLDV